LFNDAVYNVTPLRRHSRARWNTALPATSTRAGGWTRRQGVRAECRNFNDLAEAKKLLAAAGFQPDLISRPFQTDKSIEIVEAWCGRRHSPGSQRDPAVSGRSRSETSAGTGGISYGSFAGGGTVPSKYLHKLLDQERRDFTPGR
jgi:hypothetical protein